ncbi:FecR family protein [Flavivirga spongiicola]|uniref:DUF4974 domain-containing protein n=1 Tax=Flavivirga spongiicola TaxID=421621 RepID=A0ABU7XPR1_9FLAO|nr:FecR domain-containing protein [Flavivirga sp. MEBiC05379]MDO5977433.1 DUF4974 domain-containing protein [Flavivirga sp. MEBiC05379]
MNSNIEFIIQKYLEGSASEEDIILLKNWISIDNNRKVFQEHIEIQYLLDHKFEAYNIDLAHEKLMRLIEDTSVIPLNKKWKYTALLKYAALFVGLIGLSFFLKNEFFGNKKLQINNDAITIQLDNGNVEIISASGEKTILDKNGYVVGVQEGNALNYKTSPSSDIAQTDLENQAPNENLKYNELNIPYGKTFKLMLSDGTIVHLNAGTTLKYPVKFLNGKYRKVFLKGEAYFEIAKDAKHPFIVNTNDINVRALGTQFNVSSYTDDQNINTVLVEGSVGVYKSNEDFNLKKSTILTPGLKAGFNKTNKNILVESVDTNIYTGWVHGKMIFNHMPFKNIIKKLERHYNVSIQNNNKQLDDETFTATFDVETIEQVIESFSKNYEIEFSIVNNQIIIN